MNKDNVKENDWFLNTVTNPSFSISDFRGVGLDASNTSLADENTYRNIPQITDNPMFQTDGGFDEAKFHNYYQIAAEAYNKLADETYQEDIIKQATFHRDDIFVDPSQRREGPDINIFREPNPLKQKRGIRRLNLLDAPTMSIDEIAQTQKVWDPATKTWHAAPNDSFFEDFFDTRVMAQWDFNADADGNPTNDPARIVHKKGELKLNENGTYYYENLNGREVYGRKVLSKLDTLTTDGSFWNKYDFFDSDDLQKSVGGTLMKNIATIAPMFIPGIGAWYIGAGIAMEMAKVGAVLGKIFTGSDNKFLSAVEGFTQSLKPTTSQYAQENAWALENMLNLTGDVFKQLYEQRWLFKYAPAMFKGSLGASEKARKTAEAQWASEYRKTGFDKLASFKASRPEAYARVLPEINAVSTVEAQQRLANYMDSYNKLGGLISKAYMTGITVQDAYGQAKEEGASDVEAAMLTLGYAAGEYAIINSRLGEWILPELRMDKEKFRQVARTLASGGQKALDNAPKTQKTQFLKKLFDAGKDIAQANYSVGKKGLSAIAANALGEGVEEVSEELLYDFSKSLSNVASWLTGSDTRLTPWDNMVDRYGLSFVGGAIGGGLFQAVPEFRNARQLKDMKYNDAYQQLVYMSRNGQVNEFLNSLDKMTLGNKYLSATKQTTNEDGELIWQEAKGNDNQDFAAKNEIRKQVKMINDILNANGASISDDTFLNIQTRKDIRYASLTKSVAAAEYLQDYNTVCLDIINYTNELNNLNSTQDKIDKGVTDKDERTNGQDEATNARRNELKGLLKEALEKKDAYLKGDRSAEYIDKALFEMSPAVNRAFMASTFIRYAEAAENKDFKDISKARLEVLAGEYKKYANSHKKDVLNQAWMMFTTMNEKTSPMFAEHSMKYYESIDQPSMEALNAIQKSVNQSLQLLNNIGDSEKLVEVASTFMLGRGGDTARSLIKALATDEELDAWNSIVERPISDEYTVEQQSKDITTHLGQFIYSKLSDITDPILAQGFINPEVKKSLETTLIATNNFFVDLEESGSGDVLGFQEAQSRIQDVLQQVRKLPHSPVTEVLDKFALSVSDSDVKISKLMEGLDQMLSSMMEDTSSFDIGEDISEQIKEAINILEGAESIVTATRTDGANIDNVFGYNATVNELNPEVEVAQISAPIADAMLQDIDIMKNKLRFFQRLNAANNEQKLNEQSKTAANKDAIIYKKIDKLSEFIPNDWAGATEFKGALKELTTLKDTSKAGKKLLTQEEKRAVEVDRMALDDAIYNFFQANSDKLDDIDALTKFINSKNFNIYSNNDEILNSESKDIDDNAFIWYLASRAAVKSSDFYNEFKNVISDSIAPVPLQELAVYMGYASIVNGSVIDKFVDAVNNSIKHDWKTLSLEEKKELSQRVYPNMNWDFALDSVVAPRFSRVSFIEGIPGSGKSSGVYNTLVTLLKKYHPEVLDSVWLAHATKDSAEKLATSLNIKDAKKTSTNDKESLMKKISSDWRETLDDKDNVIITDDMFYIDDDNILRSNFNINEVSNPPSLIMIDEISRYTTFDLDLIERFSKKYGVPVIVAGDFDQNRAVGKHEIVYKGNKATNYVQLFRNNFVRTPKLGVTMRANNVQADFNIKLLRSMLPSLRLGRDPGAIVGLHYVEDETGIYGTKVYDGLSYDLSLVKADIDRMISTLGEGEKIGFIYSDTNSEIYKLLSSATYKDKIDPKPGTSSQGLEAKYYIMDMDTHAGPEAYWSSLYTGISRAMQGSIVIHNGDFTDTFAELVGTKDDTKPIITSYSPEQVTKYSRERKSLLNEVVKDASPTKIKKRVGDPSINTIAPEIVDGGLSTEEVKGPEGTELITNNGLPTEKNLQTETVISSVDVKPLPKPVIVRNSTGKESLYSLMYTFNTDETGWVRDKDGNLIPTNGTDQRIDSFNGLSKLMTLPESMRNTKEYANIMGQLRSVIFNTKDKGELVDKVKSILNISNEVYATFALKSSAGENTNRKYGKFDKTPAEKLEHIYATDTRSDQIGKKSLVLIVGETVNGTSRDVLEIPIARLPSPLTVMNAEGMEEIRAIYNQIDLSDPNASIYNKMVQLRNALSTAAIKGAESFTKLIDVWTYTSNGIFFIDDAGWTLAGSLKSQGPTMISQAKGQMYEVDGFAYDGEWIELGTMADNAGRVVSEVMISPTGTYTYGESKTVAIAKKGQPFVLISDDVSLRGESLKDYYYRQRIEEASKDKSTRYDSTNDNTMEKKVKLVYVTPPKASFKAYFDNLRAIITKEGTPKNIGNDFTAYRMLRILGNLPGFEESEMNYLKDSYSDVMGIVSRLDQAATIEEQMEILRSPVNVKGMNSDITAQQALQNYLLRMVYQGKFGGGTVFNSDGLQAVERILGREGITGVYYNVRYDKASKDVTTMVTASTNGRYSIDGIPFMINGKVDTPSFYGDITPVLDVVLSKKVEENGIIRSTDNTAYLSGNSNISQAPKPRIQTILESPTMHMDSSIASVVTDRLGRNPNVSESDVLEFLRTDGYIVLDINGEHYVGQKNALFEGGNSVTDIHPISLNVFGFNIISGSETYNGEFDLSSREAKLTKVATEQPPVSAETGTIVLEDNNQFLTYHNALGTVKVGHAKFKAIQNAATLEEFNLAINDLPASKATLNKVTKSMGDFEPGPHRDALQRVADLVQSKLSMKENLERTDESCPVVIKIKF